MQPLEPVSIVALFPEVRRHLLALLAGLSAEEWRTPTACAGWSVKDVALHLLGGDLGNLSRRRDGLTGALDAYAPPGADLADPAAGTRPGSRRRGGSARGCSASCWP